VPSSRFVLRNKNVMEQTYLFVKLQRSPGHVRIDVTPFRTGCLERKFFDKHRAQFRRAQERLPSLTAMTYAIAPVGMTVYGTEFDDRDLGPVFRKRGWAVGPAMKHPEGTYPERLWYRAPYMTISGHGVSFGMVVEHPKYEVEDIESRSVPHDGFGLYTPRFSIPAEMLRVSE